MDLDFDLATAAIAGDGAKPPVVKLENRKLVWARKMRQQPQNLLLERAINQLGQLSAEANSLKRPVTTFERFIDSSDEQALYLLWEYKEADQSKALNGNGHEQEQNGNVGIVTDLSNTQNCSVLLGYLKIVRDRRLYLVDEHGRRYVHTPICVLDIFISQLAQQKGHDGLQLFNEMLQLEKVEPTKCAFDKPSPAFLDFLARHYGLERPIWQPTSFVIFPQFFDGLKPEDGGNKNSEESESGRPLTAMERNRRSINERYNGKNPPPMSSSSSTSPRPAQRDVAGEIIHGNGHLPARNSQAPPDTPQGRKTLRDYGHQKIW